MKTKTTPNLTASLDAVRAAAKAHSQQLAAPAAQPAPAAPVPAAKPAKNLVQCNVRLTPEARNRIRAVAHSCHVSEQELIKRWAMTLPAVEAPKMPWELQ